MKHEWRWLPDGIDVDTRYGKRHYHTDRCTRCGALRLGGGQRYIPTGGITPVKHAPACVAKKIVSAARGEES